jgi:adenylate cyclase
MDGSQSPTLPPAVASRVPMQAGLRLRLVERFLQFNAWPASRKMMLLTGPVLGAHLLGSAIASIGYEASANIDLPMLDRFLVLWSVAVAAFFVLSAGLVMLRREAPWLPYAWVSVYSLFIVALFHLFGTMSTPHMLWYPAVITLWAIYFDERVGTFSAVYLFVLILALSALELSGRLPYAPLLIDRSVDAHRNAGWFAAHVLVSVVLLGMSFSLQWLALSVRSVQEQRLRDTHDLLDRRTGQIRRYVPAQIADQILAGHGPGGGPHERRPLTVFFSDLEGFTGIAERLDPEDLSQVMNEYFTEMTAIAKRHGGTVDEFSGDAILILFGAPQFTNERDHALRAARMSLEMQSAVARLNARWFAAGIDVVFRVRMGINSGMVTVGHFGSQDRMKYTALGTHVNLAARLQYGCVPGRVLVSHSTRHWIHDQIECRPMGEVQFKGVSRPVRTYELVGEAGA